MRQVRVIADHIRFEGELVPRECWEDFDVLYGCMETLPEHPEEHVLLLGVHCHYAPDNCTVKPYIFIHQRAIQSLQDLPEP